MTDDPNKPKPTDAGDQQATDTQSGTGDKAVKEAYEGQEPTRTATRTAEPNEVNAGDNDVLGAQTNRSIVTTNRETNEPMSVRYSAAGMESKSYPPGTKLDEDGNPPEGVKPKNITRQANDGSRTVEDYTYNRDGSPSTMHSASYDRDRHLVSAQSVQYDPTGHVTETTDSTYTNNSKGQITASEAVTKNANGQVTERANTTYKYDDHGRPISETTQTFDANGKPLGSETTDRKYNIDGSETVTTKRFGADGKPLSESETKFGEDDTVESQKETRYFPDGSKEVTTTTMLNQNPDDLGTRQVRERFDSNGSATERVTTDVYADHAVEQDELIRDGKVQSTMVTKVNSDGSIENRGTTYPPGTAQRLAASGTISDGINNLQEFGDGSLDAGLMGLKDLGGTNQVSDGITALNELAKASNTSIDTAIDAIGVYGRQQNTTGSWGDHRQGVWLLKQAGKDPAEVDKLNERIEDGSVITMSDRQLDRITGGSAFRAVDILSKIGDGDAALGMYRMQHEIGNGDTNVAREIMENDGNGTTAGAVPTYMRYSNDGTFSTAIRTISGADSNALKTFQGGRNDIISGFSDQTGTEDRPPSKTYTDKDGNSITEEYKYNDDGTRSEVVTTTKDKDGNLTGKAKTEYQYGPDGKATGQTVTTMDKDGNVVQTSQTTVEKGENGQTKLTTTITDKDGKFVESNESTTDADGKVVKTVRTTAGATGGESRNVTTTEYLEDGGTKTTFQRFNHNGRETRHRVTEIHGDTATETENGHTTTVNADGSITITGPNGEEQKYPPGTMQKLNSNGDVSAAIQSLFQFGDGSLGKGLSNLQVLGDPYGRKDLQKGIDVLNALAKNGNTNIETAMAAITAYGKQNDGMSQNGWGDTENGIYLLQKAGKDQNQVSALRKDIADGVMVSERRVSSVEDGDALKGIDIFKLIGDGDATRGMELVREQIGKGDANAATKLMEEDGSGTVQHATEVYSRYSVDGTFKSALDVISSVPGANPDFQSGREALLTFGDQPSSPGISRFEQATDNLDRVKPGDLAGAIQSVTNAGDERTFISGATNVRANSDNGTIDQGVTNWLRMGAGDFDKGTAEYSRIAASDGVPGKISEAITSVRRFSDNGTISGGQDNIIRNSDDGTIHGGVTNTIGMGDGKFDKGVENYGIIAASNGHPGEYSAGIDSARKFSNDNTIAGAITNLHKGSDDGTVTGGITNTIGMGDGSFDKGTSNYLEIARSNGQPGDISSAIDSTRRFSNDNTIAGAIQNLQRGSDNGTVTGGITNTIGIGDGSFDKGTSNYLEIARSNGHPGDVAGAIDSTRSFSNDGTIAGAIQNLQRGSDNGTVTGGVTNTIGMGDGSFDKGRDNYLSIAASNGRPGDISSAIDSTRAMSNDGTISGAIQNLHAASDNGTVSGGISNVIGFSDNKTFDGGTQNLRTIAAANGHEGDVTSAISSVKAVSDNNTFSGGTNNLRAASDNGTVSGGINNVIAASDNRTFDGGVQNIRAASSDGTVASGIQNVKALSPDNSFSTGAAVVKAAGDGNFAAGTANITALGGGNFQQGGEVLKSVGAGDAARGAETIKTLGNGDTAAGVNAYNQMVQKYGSPEAAVHELTRLGNGDVIEGARIQAATTPPAQTQTQAQSQQPRERDQNEPPTPIRYVGPGTAPVQPDQPQPIYGQRFATSSGMNRASYLDEQTTKLDQLIGKMKALTDTAITAPVSGLPPVASASRAVDANGKSITLDANGRPLDVNGRPLDPSTLRAIPGVEALIAKLKDSAGASIDRTTLEALRLGNPLSFYGDKVFHQIAQLPLNRGLEASVHISGGQRPVQSNEITVSRVGLSAIAAAQGFSGPFRPVGPGGVPIGAENGLRGAFTVRGPGGELITILSYGGKITVIRGGSDGRGTGFTINGGKVSDAIAIRRGIIKGGSLVEADGPVVLTARKWRNVKKRQLLGVEIALALLLTSTAIARQLESNQEQPAQPDTEEKNKQLARASYQVITRPTWLVRPGEDLVKLAEHLFHEAEIGWLIADLNVGQIRETHVDGKRIVELQTRQRIELPVWQDIIEFHKSMVRLQVNPANLITVVNEAAFDSELVHTTLAAAMGVTAMPTPKKAPAAAATAPAFAATGFTGKVRLAEVRRAVAYAEQYKDALLNQQEETGGPTGTAGATLETAVRKLRPREAT